MKKVLIKSEDIFMKYLSEKLKLGITDGVTENEFNTVLNLISEYIYNNQQGFASIEIDTFENVVKKASEIHSNGKKGIYLEVSSNKLVAKPTYDLTKADTSKYKTSFLDCHNHLIHDIIREEFPIIKYNLEMLDCFSGKIVGIAQKVASLYVNDSITRYVNSRIKEGNWPSQCEDVDKYIFKRDIAKYIDEEGTRNTLCQLYIHAIVSVCEIMKNSNKDEIIRFSNCKDNLLAFANFKKFYAPKQFNFLNKYIFSKYEMHNQKIDVAIHVETVSFSTLSCTYSDPYEEWSDEYQHRQGIIGNEPVAIMKNRLGFI